MPKHSNDRLQGTLDLVVLKTLHSCGAMHGYASRSTSRASRRRVLRVEEGSLYPALHRMTQAGWLRARVGSIRAWPPRALLQDHRRPADGN